MAFTLPTPLRNRPFGLMRRAPRGPQARLAVSAGARGGLNFTDRLLVFVIGVAYFFSISSPLFGFQTNYTIFNHLSFVLMLPVLALHGSGASLNRRAIPWPQIVKTTWPLVTLALFALIGSSIAKWLLGVVDSYLTFGVYLILLPMFATFVADGRNSRQWAGALTAVFVLASLAAFMGQVSRPTIHESLHEIEYLVTTGFLALYYMARGRATRWLAVLLLVGSAVLNQKLTGFIVAALALFQIVLGSGWRNLKPQWRTTYAVGALIVVVAVAAVLTLLYFEFRTYLPSGNTEVRFAQYEQAMRQFQQSPVWGTAFLGGSGEAYLRAQFRIPTHSDVLDLLKHGGIIAFVLFMVGYLTVIRHVHRAVQATVGDRKLHAYFMAARFFLVTAFVTFAFNPLLLKGSFLMAIWSTAGLSLGLSLAILNQGAKPAVDLAAGGLPERPAAGSAPLAG